MSRLVPKSIVCLRQGYNRRTFLGDLAAGLTVGIIALPLAMAFGIASIPEAVAREAGLSPPTMGLYTAVIAGFLISALGGSRVQIGGPTGAFIVIVYGVAWKHGYGGLALATVMAGIIMAILGLARIGAMIKFIPYPVTTGFTTGIAVIIFSSQIKDFFGLRADAVPVQFLDKWRMYVERAETWDVPTLAIGLMALSTLMLTRRFAPRVPGPIIAVVVASAVVWFFDMPVETIGSRFGGIPRSLPAPRLPPISPELIRELIPDATTIAMLASIESLLSAVVADGMIGGRHKADCELLAQGVANVASALVGGIPATGAIARTATNIKSGAKTPVAGMIHAGTLLLVMFFAAPLAATIPLAALSAILIMVAWNMSEFDHFRALLRAPRSDVAVLLTTFSLTIFADLTLAVGIGLVLASLLFMKRMADVSNVSAITRELYGDDAEEAEASGIRAAASLAVPAGVEVYEINGPFFFGVADRFKDTLNIIERPPKVLILRMRRVPAIDATGMRALEEFYQKCRRQGTILVLSGINDQPRAVFARSGFDRLVGVENIHRNIDDALHRVRGITGSPA